MNVIQIQISLSCQKERTPDHYIRLAQKKGKFYHVNEMGNDCLLALISFEILFFFFFCFFFVFLFFEECYVC